MRTLIFYFLTLSTFAGIPWFKIKNTFAGAKLTHYQDTFSHEVATRTLQFADGKLYYSLHGLDPIIKEAIYVQFRDLDLGLPARALTSRGIAFTLENEDDLLSLVELILTIEPVIVEFRYLSSIEKLEVDPLKQISSLLRHR